MKTFSQYIALKEQAPVAQPVQTTQPVKPGQPQTQTQAIQQVKPGTQTQAAQQVKPGTQPIKPGQPQPNIDTKKLSDAFTALKSILAPFGIK